MGQVEWRGSFGAPGSVFLSRGNVEKITCYGGVADATRNCDSFAIQKLIYNSLMMLDRP